MTPTYLNLVTEGHQLMLDLEPPAPSSISDFQQAAMTKHFSVADGIDATWCIRLKCGTTFGTLPYPPPPPAVQETKKVTPPRYTTRKYWLPIIERAALKPLQRVDVPFDARWDNAMLARHISSWAANEKQRGKTRYSTHKDDERGCVEVVRLVDAD